jgi:lipoyl(octanoyl) transferase
MNRTKLCGVMDWGRVDYPTACASQAELVKLRQADEIPDLLILCEHSPVITLGRNARRENILLPEAELARRGVAVHPTNRGGDVTYHGPGQLVGYPILHLAALRKDVVWYVRSLEEMLIRAVSEFGVAATRRTAPAGKRELYTGVWVGKEKLAAIGVHLSRWVTSHGFALNVTTDLSHFDFIVPCGLADRRVTSLARLLSPDRSGSTQRLPPLGSMGSSPWPEPNSAAELMAAVKQAVTRAFGEVFGRRMQPIEPGAWEAWLGAQQAAAS